MCFKRTQISSLFKSGPCRCRYPGVAPHGAEEFGILRALHHIPRLLSVSPPPLTDRLKRVNNTMGGENTPHEAAAGASGGAKARAVPLDGDEFVVVEQENLQQQADLPRKGPSPVPPAESAAALGYVLKAARSCLFLTGRGVAGGVVCPLR